MRSKSVVAVSSLVLMLGLASCGGSSSTQFHLPPPSVPSISSISPTSATAGGSDVLLSVTGSNFVAGSVVVWNGPSNQVTLVTTFLSSTQLTAVIPAALLMIGGGAQLFVSNPTSQSSSVAFTINYPLPAVSSITPANAQAGAAPLTLTVNGSGFFPVSVVQWNGSARPTAFVNSMQLTAAITIADLASAETSKVSAFNPTPGGGVSSAIPFTVQPFTNNPAPAISSLSDMSALAGWPGFPLTINGTGFVASTISQWNALNRPTRIVDSMTLKSLIPASDLSNSGGAQVAVFNASPGGGTSSSLSFTIKPVPPGSIGVIERSSLASDLSEGDANSGPSSIDADGRFIAFSSSATTLVPDDSNGFDDVFLRDTCLGAPAGCLPSVIRVSVATDGTQGNGFSFNPSISASGRYVAFVSDANNLVPGDTNGFSDVFVRDTCFGASAGCLPSTTRVSLDNFGNQIGLQNDQPAISGDGRFVAFVSGMSSYYYQQNFNVLVRDTCAGAPVGCKPSTTSISVDVNGNLGSFDSSNPTISSDGRFVAFQSNDQNLVPGRTNNFSGIFVRDTCLGAPAGCKPSTTLVSVAPDGGLANGSSATGGLSSDGRFVAFESDATDLVAGDTNSSTDVFVRDTCAGAPAGCTPSTVRVSVSSSGSQGNSGSHGGALSSDGRFVTFESDATNLVAGDTNSSTDVFVRDTCAGAPPGCTPLTVRVSVTLDGLQGNGNSVSPVIGGDGRFIAFISGASNLAPGDTNKAQDVFLTRTGFPVP